MSTTGGVAEPAPARGASANKRNDRNQQAHAATVMQAGVRAPATTAGPRIRPVMALGLLAGVVTLGFAIYVYLQITNPGMFIRQPAPAAKPKITSAP